MAHTRLVALVVSTPPRCVAAPERKLWPSSAHTSNVELVALQQQHARQTWARCIAALSDPCPETHAQRERAQMSPSRTSQGQPSRQMRARRIARSLRPCLAQHVDCCARNNAQKHMLVSRSVKEANLSIPQVVLPPLRCLPCGLRAGMRFFAGKDGRSAELAGTLMLF